MMGPIDAVRTLSGARGVRFRVGGCARRMQFGARALLVLCALPLEEVSCGDYDTTSLQV